MKNEINKICIFLTVCICAMSILPVLGATKETKPMVSGGQIVEGFQLIAQATKSTFAPAEPVTMSVTLKNTTDKTLKYVQSYAKYDYSITVIDSNGNPVPLTHYGNRLKTEIKTVFGIGTVELQKGEETKYTFPLNRFFDMTETGDYFVTVSYSIPKQEGTGFVPIVSNTIQIKVVEPRSSPEVVTSSTEQPHDKK